MTAPTRQKMFLVEALLASTIALLLLASVIFASLRAERRAARRVAERAVGALAASARHARADGATPRLFVDDAGLSLADDGRGGVLARARTTDGRVVELAVESARLEGAP